MHIPGSLSTLRRFRRLMPACHRVLATLEVRITDEVVSACGVTSGATTGGTTLRFALPPAASVDRSLKMRLALAKSTLPNLATCPLKWVVSSIPARMFVRTRSVDRRT